MSTDPLARWETSAHKLAEGAWCWLGAVHRDFALDPLAVPEQLDLVRDLQPLGELALAGSLAVREGVTGGHGARVALALVAFAWEQFRAGELLFELLRDRPMELFPLDTYAIFVRAGYRHLGLEALLAHLAGLRATRSPEVVPNRALGTANGERLVGLPERWDTTELAARTLLGAYPEPWAVDLDALYAITHTVYHLTDWAARPNGLPAHLQDYLHAWLPVWLEVYLEAGHWDVVAELLVVDLCLAQPAYPAPAWTRLRAAQHADGLLPAEAWRDTRTTKNLVRNHYHSGVVATIAGTLGVARRLDPHRR